MSFEQKKYLCKIALLAGHLEKVKEANTPESTSVLSELKTDVEFFSSTLRAVALQNDVSSIQSLLTLMTNNNLKLNFSLLELFGSCALLGHLEMLRLLFAYFKNDLEALMRWPIKCAALGGHVNVLEFLFASRIDKPNEKETLELLNCASSRNNLEAVRWLLDRYDHPNHDKEETFRLLKHISTGVLYPNDGEREYEQFYYSLFSFKMEHSNREFYAATSLFSLFEYTSPSFSTLLQYFQYGYLPKWLHFYESTDSKLLKSEYAALGTPEEAARYLDQAMKVRSEIVVLFLQYFQSYNIVIPIADQKEILKNAIKMGWENVQNVLGMIENKESIVSKKSPTI